MIEKWKLEFTVTVAFHSNLIFYKNNYAKSQCAEDSKGGSVRSGTKM